MKDTFLHNGPCGIKYFGIRLNSCDFFTLFSISFFDFSWRGSFRKYFNLKIGFFFEVLPLLTQEARYKAMRIN